MTLALEQAQTILNAALAHARALVLRPVAVAVVDAGGHIIAVQREDGASYLRADVAISKAAGALALGISSRRIAGLAALNPAAINAVGALSPRGVVPSPGGVIIVDDEGRCIGAVAVSGDTGENDEACALAGIVGAGLTAQTEG